MDESKRINEKINSLASIRSKYLNELRLLENNIEELDKEKSQLINQIEAINLIIEKVADIIYCIKSRDK